jgi:CheY-like chemotaxis protein
MKQTQTSGTEGARLAQAKILVVDDDSDLIETLRFSLDREGYEIATATNGLEALGAVRAFQPDLVVLDVMMPKENGYRVSRMIKEDEQSGRLSKKIPVILLTARNLEDDSGRGKMFRDFSMADEVIYKPFDMDALIKRIDALLEHD